MNDILTRQEVCQMLPFYVRGTLCEHQMLACQNYLRNMADRSLLLQYRDLEEMTTELSWAFRQQPVPAWVKERLMARVRADCVPNWHQRPIRHRIWRIIPS